MIISNIDIEYENIENKVNNHILLVKMDKNFFNIIYFPNSKYFLKQLILLTNSIKYFETEFIKMIRWFKKL